MTNKADKEPGDWNTKDTAPVLLTLAMGVDISRGLELCESHIYDKINTYKHHYSFKMIEL